MSRKGYTVVFAALMVLLAISIIVTRFDLGQWNMIVALTISIAKTLLVMLFFMHVYESSRLTKLAAGAGLLWLALLMLLTLSDYQTRGWRSQTQPPTPEFRFQSLDRVERQP
jgi:cytochrome c oxidase subunit 4